MAVVSCYHYSRHLLDSGFFASLRWLLLFIEFLLYYATLNLLPSVHSFLGIGVGKITLLRPNHRVPMQPVSYKSPFFFPPFLRVLYSNFYFCGLHFIYPLYSVNLARYSRYICSSILFSGHFSLSAYKFL